MFDLQVVTCFLSSGFFCLFVQLAVLLADELLQLFFLLFSIQFVTVEIKPLHQQIMAFFDRVYIMDLVNSSWDRKHKNGKTGVFVL